MGFFEKFKLVEEIPNKTYESSVDLSEFESDDVQAELDSVNTSTLIDDIYSQNGLEDKSQSIFKVEELINSLPKEMVTETKRNSVLSILESFGLTESEVITDGEKRIEMLDAVKEKINTDTDTSVSEKEERIEEFKKSIAELESQILNEQNDLKISNESITNEINRITGLIEFVGGDN